jgi:steroid delta-isomerase
MPLSPCVVRRVIADYFAATRSMDQEAWVGTFAADAVSHDPVGAPPTVGHEGLRRFFQGIVAAFHTVGVTEDRVFVNGNRVAVKWTGRGVGKNGRAVTFEGIDVFEVNDLGKIQQMWGYWDPAALMSQLQAAA